MIINIIYDFLLVATIFTAHRDVTASSNRIRLQKLIFHHSSCFGYCAAFHLQIDSTKKLMLFTEQAYERNTNGIFKIDSSKIGYFTGQVTDKRYSKLIRELEEINIDSLQIREELCCDESVKTLIIYHDGNRKFLRSMFLPRSTDKLFSILYDIYTNSELRRVSQKFEIDEPDGTQH